MPRPHDRYGEGALFLAAAAVALVGMVSAAGAQEASSASYVLLQGSLNGAGGLATSAEDFVASALGQAGTVEFSASGSFDLQSGFWCTESLQVLPVILQVQRNPLIAQNCDLSWSGNAPSYSVYVSKSCSNVDDSFYAGTNDNTLLNVTTPLVRLTCFDVEASMP